MRLIPHKHHLEMLGKMIKELYPNENYFINRDYVTIYPRNEKYYSIIITPVHWYEFCTTHLTAKLLVYDRKKLNRFLANSTASKILNMLQHNSMAYNIGTIKLIHPIEHLYEIFLDLKHENKKLLRKTKCSQKNCSRTFNRNNKNRKK